MDNEPSLPGRLEVGGLNGCRVRGLEKLWQQKGFRRFANLSLKPVSFPRSCLAQCVVLSRPSTKSALQDAPPDFSTPDSLPPLGLGHDLQGYHSYGLVGQ